MARTEMLSLFPIICMESGVDCIPPEHFRVTHRTDSYGERIAEMDKGVLD